MEKIGRMIDRLFRGKRWYRKPAAWILLGIFVMTRFPSDASASGGNTGNDDGWWQTLKTRGLEALQNAFEWVVQVIKGVVGDGLALVMDEVPDFAPDPATVTMAKGYLEIANHWIPVDFAIQLFIVYVAFLAVVLTFKLILKFIPGVG